MPTNRRTLIRERRQLDEFQTAELLSLRPALLAGSGYEIDGQFAEDRMREAWHQHERELIQAWTSGWRPQSEFANFKEAGSPGSRPKGYWKYAAPSPRRRGESEPMYIDRINGWLEGERAAWLAAEGIEL
jgi:hypothetical protein